MTDNSPNERDVLIIGGGPAGLSASLWCCDLGLSSVVFDRSTELGGQLLRIYNPIENYLGCGSKNGRELRDRFLVSFNNREREHLVGCEIVNVDTKSISVTLADNREFKGRAIILATGVRRRSLGVRGETRFDGKGILDSGAKQRRSAAGKRVAVIGGADAAVENALILAEFADKVVLIHRGPKLSAREEFIRLAIDSAKIEIRLNSLVQGFGGDQILDTVKVFDRGTGSVEDLAVDLAVIRIGVQPNSELLLGKIHLDDAGYVLINSLCETATPGIYAVGDVSNPIAPTISTAVGSAAAAVKSISARLAADDLL